MANFSFEIVSEVDLQEMDNAVNQANKELAQRHALLELEFNEFKKLHLPPGTAGQWFVDQGRN